VEGVTDYAIYMLDPAARSSTVPPCTATRAAKPPAGLAQMSSILHTRVRVARRGETINCTIRRSTSSPPISTTRWPVAAVPDLPRAASTLDFPTLPVRRIGALMGLPATDSEAPVRVAPLLQRLQELGWTDRRGVRIDYRLGDSNTMKTVAAALVALAPDILAVNGNSGLQALQQATRTNPIVFVNGSGRSGLYHEPGASRWQFHHAAEAFHRPRA
jgi:hypothetical protein